MEIDIQNLVGITIGEYELVRPLGKGGMGTVYLAQHTTLGRQVAIKILNAHYAVQPVMVERFLREARAAAGLNHRHIVQVFDVLLAEDMYCIVMEYVSGKTLHAYLCQHGPFEEQNAMNFLKVACQALDYAHQEGIIHRDIKPDNFLLTNTGILKLTDFGLVRLAHEESGLTMAGTTVGTPHYISPEQVRGERDIDKRTDIYSLGATLYHVLTGKVPFDGSSSAEIMSKHLNQPLPNLQLINRKLSKDICVLVTKMMAKKREDRFAGCADVIVEIQRIEKRQAAIEAPRAFLPPTPAPVSSEKSPQIAHAIFDARTDDIEPEPIKTSFFDRILAALRWIKRNALLLWSRL